MNSYELSRRWFDFSFENPDKVRPIHTAIYFFAIEHCNRLGWKEKFGFPTTMAMEALGIKSYNTYIKNFLDLIDFGFIELIERSKNQHSSNIIALSINDKANNKALDKALMKHATKQDEGIVQSSLQSIDSVNKQYNKEQLTTKPIKDLDTRKHEFYNSLLPFLKNYDKEMVKDFFEYWSEHGEKDKKFRKEKEKSFNTELRLRTWLKRSKGFKEKNVPQKKEKINAGELIKQKHGL